MTKQGFVRTRRGAVVAACVLSAFGWACEDVDWNWDSAWWQRPNRVVRPATHPARAAPKDAASDASAGDRGTEQPAKPSQTASRSPRTAPTAPVDTAERPGSATADAAARPGSATADIAARPGSVPGASDDRPFYRLYLENAGAEHEVEGGDVRIQLRRGHARTCASLLEMLYVPVGRLGSDETCYLIYEDPADFFAARDFAPMLDVGPGDAAGASVGTGASLRAGIACFARVLEMGVSVEPSVVDAGERNLVQALQSVQLPATSRWAAGILAGRLVSEYRYDHATARSYYQQAENAAPGHDIERTTATWWTADAWIQEGSPQEALPLLRRIVAENAGERPDAFIVRRADARIEELSRRRQ